ncbi:MULTISPECIES: ribonuclease D [Glaesserella]|uniref:Ribonuclease D n=1 Tax=Glaesserella australis TaxID=2094024 RepID=A0A328C1T9_9PAST|nr:MULTISPECIES: ribonuclease D [Glaesserella]AUI65684.1 ribonuclease D [Glaesserella sp. 15-184]RAL19030.1 ribonuclease D [Glaesserella australis]
MNKQINYCWINGNEQLAEVCQQAAQQPVVALDTEFIRTRTYYPKLGLIQLFDGQNICLIDPLVITDFSPFIDLLANRNVIKVLHACSEDLEVFQHYFKQLPQPMVDTQIMAGFIGLGQSVGFAKLVLHYLSLGLDKGASRTDWLARPLSEIQCQYAAADVYYLLPIYHALSQDLAKTRWQSAVQEECETLLAKRQIAINPAQAYKDVMNAWQLTPQQLAVLQLLAKWRIEEAEKRDLALNFIIKEQHLWQIAKQQPKHTSTLLEFMHPNEVRIHGKKLLWLVEQGRAVLPENYPSPISRIVDEPGYKQTLKQLQTKLAEIQPSDLAVELLASKRQLNQLFKWYRKGQNATQLPELLVGWRKPFGESLLSCL